MVSKYEISQIKGSFPKLKISFSKNGHLKRMFGEIDICDKAGDYWDTFKISIHFPPNFPFGVPIVYEKSHKIPRLDSRHISEDGSCCLDIPHVLLKMAKQGIKLYSFLTEIVYPYFANQIYFKEKTAYANFEYKHRFDGVKQFYQDSMKMNSTELVLKFLKLIIDNKIQGRNEKCVCQSGKKFKDCHFKEIQFLISVGREQIKKDYVEFNNESRLV